MMRTTARFSIRLGAFVAVAAMAFATTAWSAVTAGADGVALRSNGFVMLSSDGGIFTFDMPMWGAPASDPARCTGSVCLSIAVTPSGQGYWVMNTETAAIYPYGTAGFYGDPATVFAHSEPDLKPHALQIVPTPTGHGYWVYGELSGLGTVEPFGDAIQAGFFGDTFSKYPWGTGNPPYQGHPVGMAATPSGHGYWEVWSDGGVFAFGDAKFYGSTGAIHLTRDIIGITASADGKGYWLVAADGGVFAFGDAVFAGSTGGFSLVAPIIGMIRNPVGPGYWLAAADGGMFGFGGAPWKGSIPQIQQFTGPTFTLHSPIVAIAAKRTATG